MKTPSVLRAVALVAMSLAFSAPLAATADVAAGVWTTTNSWETYTPSENNLLSLRYLV